MALTLIEAAKREENIFTRGVVETFTANQRLAQIIPYREITGSLDGVSMESVLPSAGTRSVNGSFTQSEGRFDEIIQSLKIYGGEIGIDPFIIATKGPGQSARHVGLKVKAMANVWTEDFFKGDSAADGNDMDGLQTRLDGYNVVSAGTGSGGAALSLAILDEAVLRCHNAQYIAMGRQMSIRMSQAARTTGVSGYITYSRDEFGHQIMKYNDLEVVVVTDNSNNDNVLDFAEAYTGGGTANGSSMYVFGVGDEGIEGIQNGGFRVRNLGEDNTTPREDTRVEWYQNFQINHLRGVIRLRDIQDAAFTT
jgi:hypothetical protein